MTRKRFFLGCCGLLMVASGATLPRQVCAGGPADVEITGYGGTASGGWACGPRGHARYGGVGGEVRLTPSRGPDNPDGRGLQVTLAGAAERRSYRLTECGDPANCDAFKDVVPSPSNMVGGRFTVGYEGDSLGIRVGPQVFTRFDEASDGRPTMRILPDVQARFGRPGRLRLEAGLGSYSAPTLLRPGGYGGLTVVPVEGLEVTGRGGIHETFDTTLGIRGDLSGKLRLSEAFYLGAGAALSHEETKGKLDPEGRLWVGFSP